MRTGYVLVLCAALVLFFAIYAAVCMTFANLPGYEQLDLPGSGLVCVDEGQFVIVHNNQLYTLAGNLEPGCYKFTPPAAGETRGRAERVWGSCRK